MNGRLQIPLLPYIQDHFALINSRRSAAKWVATLIQKIWLIIIFPQWESRNKFVHALDESARISRERHDLLAELKEKYCSELPQNLLHQDQHLYHLPLSVLITKPNAQI